MPFTHILGQEAALATLRRALESGRVHHAYRFEGPDGVGKELAAVALSQALVCTGGDPLGCGACDACRRAIARSTGSPASPMHPDVQIVAKGFYPPETIGRSRQEVTEISVDQVRTIVLAHAAYPPHEGRARVFLIRAAEELSTGAANALLKTLEEPRQGTHFILLSSRSDRLLNTIRSRTLPVRFAPLSEEIILGILAKHKVPEDRRVMAAELSAGSASLALELADDDASSARDGFVNAVDSAIGARDLGAAVALSEDADKDRERLRENLRALGATFARRARKDAAARPHQAGIAARRYEIVARSLGSLDRNASPQLTLVDLVRQLRDVL